MSGVSSKITDFVFKSLSLRKGSSFDTPVDSYSYDPCYPGPFQDQKEGKLEYTSKVKERTIKYLSPLGNAVVVYSARVLSTTVANLQVEFDELFSTNHSNYARCFLEYCCLNSFAILTQYEDYLCDKDFQRYTFDCMVAWESPNVNRIEEHQYKEVEDQDESLFYTDLMPMLVDVEDTVGAEAFVRLAPCITVIADTVTARPLFDTLTASTSGRMPFPVYAKYLGALDKCIKDLKEKHHHAFIDRLNLSEREHIVEIDGVSQTVVQHVGSKSASGRLTLTDHALYFEPSSVMSYREPVKFDLEADHGHEVVPDLSGPWGSRVFDKAITYKAKNLSESIVFEFPELVCSTRRDYWLALIQEVIDCHKFIRKYSLEGTCRSEALARALLGVIRLHALRESNQILPKNTGALLIFNLVQGFLPWGDVIMEALLDTLKNAIVGFQDEQKDISDRSNGSIPVPNSAAKVLQCLNLWPLEDFQTPEILFEMKPGQLTILEKAVCQAGNSSKETQKAKALEEEVKPEGIGMNVAVLNELLRPGIALSLWLKDLLSWKRPLETIHVVMFLSYVIYRDWIGYMVPFLLVSAGAFIVWLRVTDKMAKYREIVVKTPSGGVSVEQMVSAQRAVSQIQGILQETNVVLLKLWSLALFVRPEVTNLLPFVFFLGALILALIPSKVILLIALGAVFTPTLKKSTVEGRFHRRLRELWHSIPPLPVKVVETDHEKRLHDAIHQ